MRHSPRLPDEGDSLRQDIPIYRKSLAPTPNHLYNPSCPVPRRGAYHDRRETRRGMRWTRQRRHALMRVDERCWRVRLSRVVLTPGMLASSPWEANASRGRWWQEAPIHQGEHDIGRRAITQGRPDCFRFTCMLMCAFF